MVTVMVTPEKWTKRSPHPRPMREWHTLTRRKCAKEVDQRMEEGEQGGEAKTTEDVNDKPATPSDASGAVAQEGKSDEAPNKNTRNKEARRETNSCKGFGED